MTAQTTSSRKIKEEKDVVKYLYQIVEKTDMMNYKNMRLERFCAEDRRVSRRLKSAGGMK